MWIATLLLLKFFVKLFVIPSMLHSQGKANSAGTFASVIFFFDQFLINPSTSSSGNPLRRILFR